MDVYHTRKNGERILIAQMTDRHLENTIKLYCSQIVDLTTIALGKYEPDDEFLGLFAQQATPEYQKTNARNSIQILYSKLSPYVMEASLRNIDVSEPLQKAFRRKDRVRAKLMDVRAPLALDGDDD